jgi:aminoacyl tRNA synthetase class II-like protein
MLFSRYKVAYEKKRKIMRNMASVAGLKKSFFAEIDKVENREDLEKLRVKYLDREKEILTAVLRSLGGMPLVKRKELGPQAHPERQFTRRRQADG